MYIPGIFVGPGVQKGKEAPYYYSDTDFAPTALNALGLKKGRYMYGHIIEELYTTVEEDGYNDDMIPVEEMEVSHQRDKIFAEDTVLGKYFASL